MEGRRTINWRPWISTPEEWRRSSETPLRDHFRFSELAEGQSHQLPLRRANALVRSNRGAWLERKTARFPRVARVAQG
jgi:hypothetical protein